jgi:hypothetical protein
MVRQLPGFQLDSGNSDVRGLSGSAGNLVLNGARPSTKSEDLASILDRIPAGNVIRIELTSGEAFGSDYAGKGQVANVILAAGGGTDGSVTAKLLRDGAGRRRPDFSASTLIKRGHSSANLSAGTGRYIGQERGFDLFTARPTNALLEDRRKVNTYAERNPFVSVALGLEAKPDRAAHLNVRLERSHFTLNQDNRLTPSGGPVRDDTFDQDQHGRLRELGGDVARPLARGTLKLVALATDRSRDSEDAYRRRSLGGAEVLGGFRQKSLIDKVERVGRLSWSRSSLLGFTTEIGGEVAFNRLSSDVRLFSVGQGGAETRIDLPIDQAKVSEVREEAFVTLGRPLTSRLRLDLGLNKEWSSLKVRGDALADRRLSFLKPSATLDWQALGGWHGQLSAKRTVAQLDFFDFISSAELNNNRVNGGNADLEPQRAWEWRGLVEHPLLGTGKLRLEIGHDRISRLQDRILTPLGFDAAGNIGSGTRSFVSGALDAPLDHWWKGLRVKANVRMQRTRVLDPVTRGPRGFNGYYPRWDWDVTARRDHGPWAYGLTIVDRARVPGFRTDEVEFSRNTGVFGLGFVEVRPDARTTFTLDAENLFGTGSIIQRDIFDPNRTEPAAAFRDYRYRQGGLRLTLTAKRTFGGASAKATTK